jgi:phage terminase large subunit-like protein
VDPVPPLEALVGCRCFGGLDLGQNDDFAAWALLFNLPDGRVAIRVRFWLPEAALVKFPNRPYDEWRRAGLLEMTEGDTTDLDRIEDAVRDDARDAGVLDIGYDRRFAQQLALHLQGAGLTMVDIPQGYGLNESIKSFSKLISDGAIVHGQHRVLTWMMDNCVLRTGRNQEVRLDKDVAKDKIDGPSAIVMTNARRIVQPVAPSYQMLIFGAHP